MGNDNNCDSKNDGLGGALKGFNNIKGSYRITHNGKFSPKYYSSGWGGGSKARIKTHKLGNTLGAISKVTTVIGVGKTAYIFYAAYKNDGNEVGKNTKITATSEAGSWLGAFGGSSTGATIGSLCCPGVGTIAGGIIGGIAGGYGGGKGNEKLGEKIFDE